MQYAATKENRVYKQLYRTKVIIAVTEWSSMIRRNGDWIQQWIRFSWITDCIVSEVNKIIIDITHHSSSPSSGIKHRLLNPIGVMTTKPPLHKGRSWWNSFRNIRWRGIREFWYCCFCIGTATYWNSSVRYNRRDPKIILRWVNPSSVRWVSIGLVLPLYGRFDWGITFTVIDCRRDGFEKFQISSIPGSDATRTIYSDMVFIVG